SSAGGPPYPRAVATGPSILRCAVRARSTSLFARSSRFSITGAILLPPLAGSSELRTSAAEGLGQGPHENEPHRAQGQRERDEVVPARDDAEVGHDEPRENDERDHFLDDLQFEHRPPA